MAVVRHAPPRPGRWSGRAGRRARMEDASRMHRRRPPRVKACRPGLEPLEARWVPAQFGVPWHDSTHLTISFVPDGTAIAGRRSDLFRTLDAGQPRADWQREVLEAFQAWAVHARINVALKPDSGDPLGTPG